MSGKSLESFASRTLLLPLRPSLESYAPVNTRIWQGESIAINYERSYKIFVSQQMRRHFELLKMSPCRRKCLRSVGILPFGQHTQLRRQPPSENTIWYLVRELIFTIHTEKINCHIIFMKAAWHLWTGWRFVALILAFERFIIWQFSLSNTSQLSDSSDTLYLA